MRPGDVTDHALLRYLERACGLDRLRLAQAVVPEGTRLLIERLGDGLYPGPLGLWLVVKRGCVVTVMKRPPKHMQPRVKRGRETEEEEAEAP